MIVQTPPHKHKGTFFGSVFACNPSQIYFSNNKRTRYRHKQQPSCPFNALYHLSLLLERNLSNLWNWIIFRQGWTGIQQHHRWLHHHHQVALGTERCLVRILKWAELSPTSMTCFLRTIPTTTMMMTDHVTCRLLNPPPSNRRSTKFCPIRVCFYQSRC